MKKKVALKLKRDLRSKEEQIALESTLKILKRIKENFSAVGRETPEVEKSIADLNKRLQQYSKVTKAKPLLNVQQARGGLQYAPKGHIFPKDRYRPNKPEIFSGARPNHLGPTCMECGQHRCQGCHPEFLTEQCPGPKDVWPT